MISLRGKSWYVAMTATSTNGSGSYGDYYTSGAASGNPSVTPSNGSGGYTYNWSITVAASGCTLVSNTSQTCQVNMACGLHSVSSSTVTLQCIITD